MTTEAKNAEYQMAVAQLDAKAATFAPPKTSSWVIIFFLTLFPPIAFYLMWKDEKYHGWFAYLNWLFGISLVLFSAFLFFAILPKINSLYAQIGYQNPNKGGTFAVVMVIVAVLQIIWGFILKKKQRGDGKLSTTYLLISIALFALDYIIPTILYSSVLSLSALESIIAG